MAASVPPGAPTPGNLPPGSPFPNYNPLERKPDLSQNFQNLNLNQLPNDILPGRPLSSVGPSRPSLTGQAPTFQATGPPAAFPGPSSVSRLNAPHQGAMSRAATPPIRPPQNPLPVPPPNLTSGRPSSIPLATQSLPFASRPPQGSSPISGPVAVPSPGAFSPPPSGFQVTPLPSSARPSGLVSPSAATGPAANAPFVAPHPISNGPPMFSAGAPRFPPSGGVQQPAVPPSSTATVRTPPQASMMRFLPGGESSASPGTVCPVSSLNPASPFSTTPQLVLPTPSPFGSQPWRTQHQAPPSVPISGPPPGMYGMQPSLVQATGKMPPAMSQTGPMSGPNKIDPNQVPRPVPSPSVILHETRQNNQAVPPPPATSTYIVQDTGNCSPRYMRCTINQIPCTSDFLGTSGMQLALLVQPLALPNPSEEPIQVVDFGESGPVRCSRCKGYINPFMKFINQGRQFICNFCGYVDETPRDYHCNLGPDGRRRDADERPELCRGTVEFVASKEYMVRDPMPTVFFFLIDVSMNAIRIGATAAACSAINQVIADLPEGPRTMVGIATFDSTIHFYNLKRALQQPLMLIVPDIQDVYTPLETDVIVPLSECRQHLELLLESIPTMYQNSKIADSAFGAAMKAAFLAMKKFGGKLLVFQSVLPSAGIGALSAKEAEGRINITADEKEANKLLQPQDKILKEMAIYFAEYQVCVDVFLTTQSYVDVASISVVPKTTGGQVYYYFPFAAVSDAAKLYNDLRWNVTRPQGFEAVMRVRCSQGLEVLEYFGNFFKRVPTDVDLPGIDSGKAIMVTLKIDDKLQDGTECAFQCALLYTTVYGQRRIRVSTLSLPCTSNLSNLFCTADLDAQFGCLLKQVANEIPGAPLMQVRDKVRDHCVSILHSYRKFCATASSSGQLILPEALRLLPLYTLALIKSTGLRSDGRIDNRSLWIACVSSISAPLAVPLVYPRMISVRDLMSKEHDQSIIPFSIPLSSEHVSGEGIYLLENGMDALIYVGSSVDPHLLQQIFGTSTVDEIPNQLVLQQHDNPLSRRFNEVINEIRRERCSYLSLKLCKRGDPSGVLFFSHMVEDKTPMGFSYVEFLVHIHKKIQSMVN